jgi:transposase-like protein
MQAGSVVGGAQAVRLHGTKRQSERRTAAQWVRIIEAQRQSGLTVVEFCRQQSIAKATFWYWRKRLLATHKHYSMAKPAPNFLPVPLVTPLTERIEVELGTMRVRLQGAEAARVVDAIVARVVGAAQQ